MVTLAEELTGKQPATPEETRDFLGLAGADVTAFP
jgi:hypothetical protein